ncbi:MAG: peroxide stress protein YaaA [Arenicella sp.]|nr:peroxide stress protein YaaA [Arenicella sp.]
MLIVISPAKTLDFGAAPAELKHTQPSMLKQSERLIDILTTKSPTDIEKMMKISPKLAELNVERYHTWSRPFTKKNAKQALLAFKGDVYTGLEAQNFSDADFEYAQNHLRILSGLYGVLRPLDLMQAYRLEMGIKLENSEGKNLYEFWGSSITDNINKQLKAIGSKTLLNLASNEYFKSVKSHDVAGDIVTPIFKDWKNGQYKIISFYAKKARGVMSAWILQNQVTDRESLLTFDSSGYQYSQNDSDALNPIFLRKQ